MKALMDRLEAAGIAENTVIVLSADHYPYGLPKENIDELAGHTVESILSLQEPSHNIQERHGSCHRDKPCESLDIIPTLSNLFASNMIPAADGRGYPHPHRRWSYSPTGAGSRTGHVRLHQGQGDILDGTEKDDEYVKQINRRS